MANSNRDDLIIKEALAKLVSHPPVEVTSELQWVARRLVEKGEADQLTELLYSLSPEVSFSLVNRPGSTRNTQQCNLLGTAAELDHVDIAQILLIFGARLNAAVLPNMQLTVTDIAKNKERFLDDVMNDSQGKVIFHLLSEDNTLVAKVLIEDLVQMGVKLNGRLCDELQDIGFDVTQLRDTPKEGAFVRNVDRVPEVKVRPQVKEGDWRKTVLRRRPAALPDEPVAIVEHAASGFEDGVLPPKNQESMERKRRFGRFD